MQFGRRHYGKCSCEIILNLVKGQCHINLKYVKNLLWLIMQTSYSSFSHYTASGKGGIQIEVHYFGGMIVLCNSKIEILFTLSNYLEYALK